MLIVSDEQLSAEILELITPIPGQSPTGVEELDNIKCYASLGLQIDKPLPNYQECTFLAADVLKKHSKNLRVAAWLTLSWFRLRGFTGLGDGLLLMAALLERYQSACFPSNVQAQIKAIQFVNTSRVTALLKKVQMTREQTSPLQHARNALGLLAHVCAERFQPAQVSLQDLAKELDSLAAIKPVESDALMKDQKLEDIKSNKTAEASKNRSVVQKSIEGDDAEPETGTDEQAPNLQNLSSPKSATAVSKTYDPPQSEPETEEHALAQEIEIPSDILELLDPISSDSPTGQTRIEDNSYFNLSMEITNIRFNAERCIEWARDLLNNSSKDINVILWLGFAWYRKDALQGLYEGFVLLAAALQKYGGHLNPLDNEARLKAFNFWKQKQLAELIRREKIEKDNSQLYMQLEAAFAIIVQELGSRLPQASRIVTAVQRSIAEKTMEARDLLKPAFKPGEEKEALSADKSPASVKDQSTAVNTVPASTSAASKTLAAEKDAWAQIKDAILYFYQEPVDGKTKPRLIVNPTAFAVSRAFHWSSFKAPVMDGKLTMIEGPIVEKQTFLNERFAAKEWITIITDIESKFISGDAADRFRYWLDGQRYVVLALEAMGSKEAEAATIIKTHLAQLLQQVPNLPKYYFKDGKTAVASAETRQWIDEHVKPLAGSRGSTTVILPPIFGEEYDAINKEYETAQAALPGNFEETAQAMQKAIEGDQRRKGRFLRQLNLANYCHAAKQHGLAKALLSELMQKIEGYQLAEWEPSLCLAVWQTAYLTNKALLKNQSGTANVDLEKQQGLLYEKIGALDIQRALKLATA